MGWYFNTWTHRMMSNGCLLKQVSFPFTENRGGFFLGFYFRFLTLCKIRIQSRDIKENTHTFRSVGNPRRWKCAMKGLERTYVGCPPGASVGTLSLSAGLLCLRGEAAHQQSGEPLFGVKGAVLTVHMGWGLSRAQCMWSPRRTFSQNLHVELCLACSSWHVYGAGAGRWILGKQVLNQHARGRR